MEASGARLGIEARYEWVATDSVSPGDIERLVAFDGLWAAPGAPYRSLESVTQAPA